MLTASLWSESLIWNFDYDLRRQFIIDSINNELNLFQITELSNRFVCVPVFGMWIQPQSQPNADRWVEINKHKHGKNLPRDVIFFRCFFFAVKNLWLGFCGHMSVHINHFTIPVNGCCCFFLSRFDHESTKLLMSNHKYCKHPEGEKRGRTSHELFPKCIHRNFSHERDNNVLKMKYTS